MWPMAARVLLKLETLIATLSLCIAPSCGVSMPCTRGHNEMHEQRGAGDEGPTVGVSVVVEGVESDDPSSLVMVVDRVARLDSDARDERRRQVEKWW